MRLVTAAPPPAKRRPALVSRRRLRARVAPALALSTVFGLVALGGVPPMRDALTAVRGPRIDLAVEQGSQAQGVLEPRTEHVAEAEGDAVPLLAPARWGMLPGRLALAILPEPVLLAPPAIDASPIADLLRSAELSASAITAPEAGRHLAALFAHRVRDPDRLAADGALEPEIRPLRAAAAAFKAMTTVDAIPLLLPEPPPGWRLGAEGTVAALVRRGANRISLVAFARKSADSEQIKERYVGANDRDDGQAAHPPLPELMEPTPSGTARSRALPLTAALIKLARPEPLAPANIDGRSIECLPSGLKLVLLDLARLFGPIHVNSSYRSPSHNRRVGGATRSLHMECRAVDFRINADRGHVVRYLVGRREVGGYKHYGRHIHIDNGPRRSW